MWFWEISYPEDDVAVSGQGVEFVVPVDTNIKLIIIAEDVLHSFFIPNFRVKTDAVPGRYTTLSLHANGVSIRFCVQSTGKDHSNMLAHAGGQTEEFVLG